MVLGLLAFIWLMRAWRQSLKIWVDVPSIGKDGILGQWITALQWQQKARSLIQEGYEKHGHYAFKIATPSRWEIFICNEKMIKEYKNLMDDKFSANAVTADMFQTKWTAPGAAEGVHKIPIPLLAKALTWQRNRSSVTGDTYFKEFVTEFLHAWEVETKITSEGPYEFCCFETGTRIVAHLTAKSLVGHPLCRDPEIIDLFAGYGNAVPSSGFLIAMFPGILKPLVAKFCEAPKMSDRLDRIFLSEMKERQLQTGSDASDIMSWLWHWTQENEPGKYSEVDIVRSITSAVFGAIHTTTQVLVHCLFELATRPEYVEPLRQEVQQAVENHGGWEKEGIESMLKLDSFIKECQRFNPLDSGSLARCATNDFTFSNGLKVAKGTYVFAPNAPVLFDERFYPNPHQFDGYRFYRLGQQTGKPQGFRFVATNSNYLQFGDGRHTCPGRYMAADEIRLMLGHILLHYDITTKENEGRPKNWFFKKILFPDMKGVIVLKKRAEVRAVNK
uniref:Cytochrome P450 monooxygenase janQ n=1 Tax=Penicillium janthinellum TaxID=5079 RepID=JANQ_PENJA|nr:RecName: Full=Cytochrome P450 monooxygenase janQ; AltName: Full=Janthitremanes biosynthesis cluster protein Q [Penicillium janthinellum]AGZ20487.1 cytochrome P450 monooxygenase [Penicillium janthinellum]